MITGFGKPPFPLPKKRYQNVSFGNITESSLMMNGMKCAGKFLAILTVWVSLLSL